MTPSSLSHTAGDAAPDAVLRHVIMTRVTQLDATVHGLVTGIVLGLSIFIATNWLVVKGGEVVGPHLSLLGQFFFGYSATFVGSFVGLGYGFITGFALGWFVAALYNWLLRFRKER
ncbi:MAG: hypothetical protein IT329_13125 [Caldilineaceae bacterium]|nr:hypothetical protein [Caldilineaceae bacterium]